MKLILSNTNTFLKITMLFSEILIFDSYELLEKKINA